MTKKLKYSELEKIIEEQKVVLAKQARLIDFMAKKVDAIELVK